MIGAKRHTSPLGAVMIMALAATLAGCGASLPSLQSVGSAQVSAAKQTATASAAGATNATKPFNPFRDDSAPMRPKRVVIKDPTPQQVLKPGPLKEIALGPRDAKVTVIKYASPTCPYCRKFQAETFPKFKREFIDTGKARFVLREFPIGHQSGAATIAIRCAPAGQRLALYEALLESQQRWVSQEVRREPIFRVAKRFGLSRAKFDACYQDKQLVAELKAIKDRGRTLGIIGTPNFFINNRLEKRVLTIDDFHAIIDPILAGGRTAAGQ